MVKRRAVLLGVLVVIGACKPNIDQTVSLVGGPRVLAVRSDPAEAAPKTQVAYTALVVDDTGDVSGAGVDWAFCEARKPLAQLGPVSPQCLQATGDALVPIGDGLQVSAPIPDVACRQFGPETPESMPGQPSGRPVDPDTTGGYYQPLRVLATTAGGDVTGIAETRLSCGLAGASADQSAAFNARYRANVNPIVDSLVVVGGATWTPDTGGATNVVAAGQKFTLRVAWATCPVFDVCGDGICGPDETMSGCPGDCTKPAGCTGAERYVSFDLASQTVVDQREGMHVAWFATAGGFDVDTTGRDASDTTSSSDDGWVAPSQPGTVHLWVVLRDDRGGTGWAGYVVDVQ